MTAPSYRAMAAVNVAIAALLLGSAAALLLDPTPNTEALSRSIAVPAAFLLVGYAVGLTGWTVVELVRTRRS